MADDILYDLYWGDLRPGEAPPERPEEIQRMEKQFYSGVREMAAAAGGDACKRLDDLLCIKNEIESFYGAAEFVQGFKLGVKLMVAVMQHEERQ